MKFLKAIFDWLCGEREEKTPCCFGYHPGKTAATVYCSKCSHQADCRFVSEAREDF